MADHDFVLELSFFSLLSSSRRECGVPHGWGKMIYPDNSFYEGAYCRGQRVGHGVWIFLSDSSHELPMIGRHGDGTDQDEEVDDAARYDFEANRNFTVESVLREYLGEYHGDFANDLPTGFGIIRLNSGQERAGQFEHGVFVGPYGQDS